MSDFATHIAAIGVGIAITLLLVGGFNSSSRSNDDGSSGIKAKGAPSTSTSTSTSAAPKKRNRKKTKKKATAAPAASAASTKPALVAPPATNTSTTTSTTTVPEPKPTPAPVAAAAPVAAVEAPAPSGGKKKKKNKKNKVAVAAAATPAVAVSAAPAAAPAPAASTKPATDNGTTKQPTTKQLTTNSKPAAAMAPVAVPFQPIVREEESWETIPKKSKKKRNNTLKQQQAASGASSDPAAPKAASVTATIDASRVGIIIGPKGATMNAIQEKTGTKLDVNAPARPEDGGNSGSGAGNNQFRPVLGGRSAPKATATVVITGGINGSESLKQAKQAVLELADRGYATLLQAEGFGESSVAVHPRFLSEIVGTGGRVIKAIQSGLDVKLTIPKTDWSPKTVQIGNIEPSCRIGIAGDVPANVKAAKQVVKDLCNYHHHEITHPSFTHQEVFVPQEFFHCIIGTRGSEIKHIRGNYGVDVYMPSSESWCTTDSVVCVGTANNVEKAISYIKLLMDRDTELREQKYSDEHFGDDAEGW